MKLLNWLYKLNKPLNYRCTGKLTWKKVKNGVWHSENEACTYVIEDQSVTVAPGYGVCTRKSTEPNSVSWGDRSVPREMATCERHYEGLFPVSKERHEWLTRQGELNGYGGCGLCRGTWDWKKSHTTYSSSGDCGMFVLCESCFDKLTPEQRWPFYEVSIRTFQGERQMQHYMTHMKIAVMEGK